MTAGSYTALVSAYGKAGDTRGAQRVFDEARAAGVGGPSLYTSLQQTYARHGDLARAQDVFRQPEAEGWLDSPSYSTMILAYCEAGHCEDADHVLAAFSHMTGAAVVSRTT
jgi:pentatricopeptide repeat protein